MAKIQSFADKVAKGTKDFTTHCPKCDESYNLIKLISSDKSEKTGAYKFAEKMVRVCKCNENEITS